MIAFQNPKSFFTRRIFDADLLAVWVNVGIRAYSGTVWTDGFALLKAIVCGEGVLEGSVLAQSLLVHYNEWLRAKWFFMLLVPGLNVVLLLILRVC